MTSLLRKPKPKIGGLIGSSLLVLTSALIAPAPASATTVEPAAASTDVATDYLVNAAHDGKVGGATELPGAPLKWSRFLGGDVSYPIIVPGHVFVTTVNPSGPGTVLHALNPASGLDQWTYTVSGSFPWSALTYGGGNLFVLNPDGLLFAFNPDTGGLRWSEKIPGQPFYDAAPTFKNGRLYVGAGGSGGTLYSIDARSGDLMWAKPVTNGDRSSPTVTSTGVYVTYACQQDYDFDPVTGALLWHYEGPGSGGGGETASLGGGYLWANPDYCAAPMALNPADGTQATVTIPYGGWIGTPAFDGKTGFYNVAGTLTALKTTATHSHWKFAGDGDLVGQPLVANGYVYMGSERGKVYALDEATGALVWTGDVGSPIEGNNPFFVGRPPVAPAAGQGLLVIPATDVLVAYGP